MSPARALHAPFQRLLRHAPTGAAGPEGTLAVRGELDFHTVAQLCRHLEDQLAGRRHIALDLTGATFYDQAAVDALTELQERARRAGRRITVTTPATGRPARTAPALASL
jgi:ABC-type transporter Mla MlaB component